MRLVHYINAEELEQELDNNYIETRYTGKTPTLLERDDNGIIRTDKKGRPIGKKGQAYFNVKDDQWYFRVSVYSDWIRVNPDNIDCIGIN